MAEYVLLKIYLIYNQSKNQFLSNESYFLFYNILLFITFSVKNRVSFIYGYLYIYKVMSVNIDYCFFFHLFITAPEISKWLLKAATVIKFELKKYIHLQYILLLFKKQNKSDYYLLFLSIIPKTTHFFRNLYAIWHCEKHLYTSQKKYNYFIIILILLLFLD